MSYSIHIAAAALSIEQKIPMEDLKLNQIYYVQVKLSNILTPENMTLKPFLPLQLKPLDILKNGNFKS